LLYEKKNFTPASEYKNPKSHQLYSNLVGSIQSSVSLKLFPKGIEFSLELFDAVWKIGDHDVFSILRSRTFFFSVAAGCRGKTGFEEVG
jgi:hypothetical protein